MTDEPSAEEPPTPAPARVRRAPKFVIALIGLATVAGVALLIVGLLALGRADESLEEAAALRRERRVLEAWTATAEREVDAPISDAERVAKSVTTIVEASDTVVAESAATNRLLDQAVRLANSGRRGAANELLSGDAAQSVQRLNETLTRAQAALAAAQLAAIELDTATP